MIRSSWSLVPCSCRPSTPQVCALGRSVLTLLTSTVLACTPSCLARVPQVSPPNVFANTAVCPRLLTPGKVTIVSVSAAKLDALWCRRRRAKATAIEVGSVVARTALALWPGGALNAPSTLSHVLFPKIFHHLLKQLAPQWTVQLPEVGFFRPCRVKPQYSILNIPCKSSKAGHHCTCKQTCA